MPGTDHFSTKLHYNLYDTSSSLDHSEKVFLSFLLSTSRIFLFPLCFDKPVLVRQSETILPEFPHTEGALFSKSPLLLQFHIRILDKRAVYSKDPYNIGILLSLLLTPHIAPPFPGLFGMRAYLSPAQLLSVLPPNKSSVQAQFLAAADNCQIYALDIFPYIFLPILPVFLKQKKRLPANLFLEGDDRYRVFSANVLLHLQVFLPLTLPFY